MVNRIPIFMAFVAFVAVVTLGVTIYYGYRQTQHSQALLSVQLAQEFRKNFESAEMVKTRSRLAAALLKHTEPDDNNVADLFETMGYYVRKGALDQEAVYNDFSYYVVHYWPALKDDMYKQRSGPHGSSDYYTNFEWLNEAMLKESSRRGRQTVAQATPSPDDVHEFLVDESQPLEGSKRPRHRAK